MGPAFSSESEGDTSIVRIRGALDALAVGELGDHLEAFVGARHAIVLDLSEVTALDHLALAVVLETRERARAESGSLTIRNPSNVVRKVVEGAAHLDLIEPDSR